MEYCCDEMTDKIRKKLVMKYDDKNKKHKISRDWVATASIAFCPFCGSKLSS